MAGITESTVNAIVGQYLAKKLHLLPEESVKKLFKGRKQPDFSILEDVKNGPRHTLYVEAEWQSKMMLGMEQMIEYKQLPHADAALLILYPDYLKESLYQAHVNDESLIDLLKEVEFKYMAYTAEGVIGIGKNQTIRLDDIPELISNICKSQIELFDDKAWLKILGHIVKGFATQLDITKTNFDDALPSGILGGQIETEGLKKRAYVASAYVLINQISFYEILSRTDCKLFPKIDIDKIKGLSDIQTYHDTALEVDYDSIFSMKIVGSIPPSLLELVIQAIKILRVIPSEFFTSGGLGTIFHTLIPYEIRKPMAAFYTLPETAKLLGKLVVEDKNDTVIDPACGSGNLLVAAYQAKKEKYGKGFNDEIHAQFLEKDILGIDFMPFAAHLAAMHLALQNPQYLSAKTNIAIHDAMSV